MNTKNVKPLSEARDADARHTVAALQRAASNAKLLAEQTHTPLVVVSQPGLSAEKVQSASNAQPTHP